ncbi:MAG TPA: hypothetical protein VIK14_13715 [Ignavibacteria bacterium]
MYNMIVTDKTGLIEKQKTRIRTSLNRPVSSIDTAGINEAINILIAEGGDGFYNYVDWRGLSKDPNLIVLSSKHNFFYDAEEMSNVKTVINLKELNQIKRIKSILQSYLHFLPQKSNFVGCFVDNEKINGYVLRKSSSSFDIKKNFDAIENSIVSQIPFINMLYSIMDSRTNTYMSKRSVTSLLDDYGFKVIDMTELNGITFFHSQKIGDTYN